MAKYQTSKSAEITGWGLKSYFDSLVSDEVIPIIIPVLNQYGLESVDDIQTDGWYPIQLTLDMFKAIDKHSNASANYVALGMSMSTHAPMPEEIETIPHFIAALNDLYVFSVRNFPESELYEHEIVNDRHIRLVDNNPYPHDMIYGLVYGFVKRYAPANSEWTVTRTYKNPADPNADGAVYDITW